MGRLLKHILKSYIGLFSPVSLPCDNALGWLMTDLTCANLFSCIACGAAGTVIPLVL